MKKLLLTIFLFLFVANAYTVPLFWQPLAPGLEYTKVDTFNYFPGQGIYAFRIDLKYNQLQLALAQNIHQSTANIIELVTRNGAVLGVNGGFFTPQLKPLGLRISQGQVMNPFRPTRWWGVFFIRNSQPYIVAHNQYHSDQTISFAVQSGPRLLIDGNIPRLKPGLADRTALGITQDHRVVILATENFPLRTQELAEILRLPMQQGGFGCTDALNLDGGRSTQLFAHFSNFTLFIPGINQVTDAVLVVPKSAS